MNRRMAKNIADSIAVAILGRIGIEPDVMISMHGDYYLISIGRSWVTERGGAVLKVFPCFHDRIPATARGDMELQVLVADLYIEEGYYA